MIHRLIVALVLIAIAVPALAQSTTPPASTTSQPVEFLSRAAFRMGAEHLSGDDAGFVWDANFGGDIDFLDWGVGRATFIANYQVILGEEFKSFDPNQGNYILGLSGTSRLGGVEVAVLFHHESRHLADRLKRTPVDWNMFGMSARRTMTIGSMFMDGQVKFRGVVQKSFVDYRWELEGRIRNDLVLRPRVGVLLGLDLKVLGVDGSRNRGTQTGVRVEGGVRFDGQMGAVELFLAGERRVDPYPLEFGTANWLTAGFRLLSR